MIDTIKIYTMINKSTYDKIYNNSILKTSYNKKDGQIYYEIVNDKLDGSYSSSLSVRVGSGVKYKFINMYYIEIEGSFHKIMLGYNSHNGFYNLVEIVQYLIGAVEYAYNIKLPKLKNWFLQRIDIAICFDLLSNKKVCKYINNLSLCTYPRRNIKHYQDESIYCTGTSTTLKIYNKLLEFKKHDMKKLFNTNFNIDNYLKEIDGFIRFECEIKKKKLQDIYNKKYIRVRNVDYKDLRKVWSDEFMKILNMFESDLTIVKNKEDIKRRLFTCYSKVKANNLYNFYSAIMLDGIREIKKNTSKTAFYRNMQLLKSVNIDLSQKYKLTIDNDIVDFNPFEWKEVV
mgnify:CR=1 FL=1